MLAFVLVHLVVAGALPALARRSTRAAFFTAAVPPAAMLVWALAHAGSALHGVPRTESLTWAPLLGLEFTFRLDSLALLLTILVTGIGALVLVYSAAYFGPGSGAARRSAPLLLTFAAVMLGLVLADDLLTVYVFWELTTICSFLLVGQAGVSRESRRSSVQALMVTTLGGLVMLLGFVVLGESAGTYRISELTADPPGGAPAAVAAVLVLVGAFTKSAQLPFHNWLPAAMIAPTPISAYLHAASMVKAGVFLVARMAPIFADVELWTVLTVVFGLVTMIVAGWRALHEYDLKKLLAYGTVSQLGFLMVLAGPGTYTTMLAADTMLLAHGMFKAALFLGVGIIDHQAGTRDVRELSGLGRRMPWLATLTTIAALSMAGVPPTLGFLGKEAAFESFIAGGGALSTWGAIGLLIGSIFTAGYTARLLWGAFATKEGLAPTRATAPSPVLWVPAALPAAVSLVLGIGYPITDALAAGYATNFAVGTETYHLELWHGFNLALLCSVIALVGGAALHLARNSVGAFRARLPRIADAQRGYESIMATLERTAVGITGRIQAGSLPIYLGVILVMVLLVPGTAMLAHTADLPVDLRAYDNPLQVALALGAIVAAFAVLRARRRLTAVLMVGIIGYCIGGLFIVDGGPDLALAQFMVETLTLVVFVFVLRRLPVRFRQERESNNRLRWPRALVAGTVGTFIAVSALVFSAARQAPSAVSGHFIANAEEGAGAENVVNAILVDFRALDTVGEISVLGITATGVASLILAGRHERRRRSTRTAPHVVTGSPPPSTAADTSTASGTANSGTANGTDTHGEGRQ
ncbi:hydrogen gas-evolving membrane-bound hydrogenase subunit E [Bounagaea algeriensis]